MLNSNQSKYQSQLNMHLQDSSISALMSQEKATVNELSGKK